MNFERVVKWLDTMANARKAIGSRHYLPCRAGSIPAALTNLLPCGVESRHATKSVKSGWFGTTSSEMSEGRRQPKQATTDNWVADTLERYPSVPTPQPG